MGEIPIKLNKSISFVIVALLLCPIICAQVQLTEAATPKTGWKFPLINAIGALYGSLVTIVSFAEGFKAVPNNITIGYNEKVTIQLGNIDIETGNFSAGLTRWFLTQRILSYSVEFPDGNSGGWFVNFDPPLIIQQEGVAAITNVTIALYSPPQASETIQSTTLRIRIADTWAIKNLWFPEGLDNTILGIFKGTYSFPFSPLGWFPAALFGGFGKNSGKVLTDYYFVDLLVKVKPFHSVKINALPPGKLSPNDVVSIPVLVQSYGNYNDTISFRAKSENGSLLRLTQNNTITLSPGEQGQLFIGVASPNNFLDTGTLHSITLEAFSTDQPNVTIATQNIMLETQGLYVSEENATYIFGAGLIIIFVVIILLYWRRKASETIRKKPEKPWKLPEEQQHLAELKRTDKNAYEQERIMMQDEYKSALLSYKQEKRQFRVKTTEEKSKNIISSFFKKLQASFKAAGKPKKKPKKKQAVRLKKQEKKPKEPIVKPIAPIGDITKDKVLAKIKREQEKQLRKLQ